MTKTLVISVKDKGKLKDFPGAILLPSQRINKGFVKVLNNNVVCEILNSIEKNKNYYFSGFEDMKLSKTPILDVYPAVNIRLLLNKSQFNIVPYDEVMRQIRYKLAGYEFGIKTAYSMLHYFSINTEEYKKGKIVVTLYGYNSCRDILENIFERTSIQVTDGTCLKDMECA